MSVEIQTMGEGGIFEIAAVVIDEVLEIQPFTDVEYEILSSARDILAEGSILEAATVATNSANTAAGLASEAASAANGAASAANDAAGAANSATTSANTAAGLASEAASAANGAASAANDAAGAANTAASSANSAASAANTAAATAASFVGTGPAGYYATLTALQAAYPTGDTGIYVELEYGHWYYWSGSAWIDGGLFQAPLAVVQTTGASETDVMSQKAVTDELALKAAHGYESNPKTLKEVEDYLTNEDSKFSPYYNHPIYHRLFKEIYINEEETTTISLGISYRAYNNNGTLQWMLTFRKDNSNLAQLLVNEEISDIVEIPYLYKPGIFAYAIINWNEFPENTIIYASSTSFNSRTFHLDYSPAISTYLKENSLLDSIANVNSSLENTNSNIRILKDKTVLNPLLKTEININACNHIFVNTDIQTTPFGSFVPVFNNQLFELYNLPNVLKFFQDPSIYQDYPFAGYIISKQELEAKGIIPNDEDPPLVNLRLTKIKNTAVGCNPTTVYFLLRYGKSLTLNFETSNDVMVYDNRLTWAWMASGEDVYWNSFGHEVALINDDLITGYIHKNIPIPLNYKGYEFKGIVMIVKANSTAGSYAEHHVGLPAVVLSEQWKNDTDPYINDADKFLETIQERNLSKTLKSKLESNTPYKEITIKNSDRILLNGDSFTAGGGRDFRDKGWVSMFSQLSDWTCEGFGQSGDGYIDVYNLIINNTKRYHDVIGIRDFNKTYFLVSIAENDTEYHTWNPTNYWRDIVTKTVRLIKSVGAIPILHTGFGNFAASDVFLVIQDIAEKEDCLFWDISTTGYLFNQTRYLPFWSNGHPGVRTNTLLWYETVKLAKELPYPKKGIKIFRNRTSFDYNDANELLFNSIIERMKKWREISIGHGRATEATQKYYDELDLGLSVTNKETSEYLKLINNEDVLFQDKALIQVTVPSTCEHTQYVKLKINNKSVPVYVRKFIDYSDLYDLSNSSIKFILTSTSFNAFAGDVYSTNDSNYSGITFTVVSLNADIIIAVPSSPITEVPGLIDATLTKVSGNGDSSITYNSMTKSMPVSFVDRIDESNGVWELLSPDENGDYTIVNPIGYMDYDKLYFMLDNNNVEFYINDVIVEYISNLEKQNKYIRSENTKYDTELLSVNTFDTLNINSWTNPYNLVPFIPADSNTPVGTPSEVIELTQGKNISQSITTTIQAGTPKKVKITAYARRFPQIFDSEQPFSLHDDTGNNEIWEDSYDFAEIAFVFKRHLGAVYPTHEFKEYVPLWWVKIEREFYLTAPNLHTYDFIIKCNDKSVQISSVSVKVEQ